MAQEGDVTVHSEGWTVVPALCKRMQPVWHLWVPQVAPVSMTPLLTPFGAGVATAFAAPIGGLLFTIEEGASFYSTSIFWRGFLSTGIGVFTLHFLVECALSAELCVLAANTW